MTGWMKEWVIGSGLVDTIIAITLLEVGFLLLYHQQTKRGLAPRDYLLNVLSGLSLMLALRCCLAGSAWFFIAAWLAAAGAAHVADITMRLQQRSSEHELKQPS